MGNRQSWYVHSCDKSVKSKTGFVTKEDMTLSDTPCDPVPLPVQKEPKATIPSLLRDPQVNKTLRMGSMNRTV